MKWSGIGGMNCSVARALSVVGDRWTMLIVRNAFLGIRRFEQFQSVLGMTRHLLADRLKRLVEAGVFERVPYEGNRHEYRLTEKGKALYPVLLTLTAWGDAWMDDGAGPPLLLVHRNCGRQTHARVVCDCCGEELKPRDVTPMAGPGMATRAGGDS